MLFKLKGEKTKMVLLNGEKPFFVTFIFKSVWRHTTSRETSVEDSMQMQMVIFIFYHLKTIKMCVCVFLSIILNAKTIE